MPLSSPATPIVSIGRERVLYVMATTHEYTSTLQELFTPLVTGVGPVEAALALSRALADLKGEGALPTLIVAVGSAGSAKLDHGGVYQASEASYRDMDCSALGFARGVTPFLDQPAVIPLTCPFPSVRRATLSTGANIVSGDGYAGIDADMVDMETYAYARAARGFGVPVASLRGISDGRNPLSGRLSDWTDPLSQIGKGLARAVAALHQRGASLA